MKAKIIQIRNHSLVKRVMRPLRYGWYFIALFLILFFSLYFILKIPSVQNYVADKVTSTLSDKLNTVIEIDRIDINLFRGVELEHFYLEDLQGDTLIYAGSFYSDFYNSLKSFYSKDFNITSLDIEHGVLKLKRTNRDPLNNLQRLFNQSYNAYDTTGYALFKSIDEEDDPNKPKAFSLDLKKLNFRDICFENVDSLKGDVQHGHIDLLRASLDTFDINNLVFVAKKVSLGKVEFSHTRIFGDTLIRRIPQVEYEEKELDFDLKIKQLKIDNGEFTFVDSREEKSLIDEPGFNPYRFKIEEILVNAENVHFVDPYYLDGKINEFSLVSGEFKIESVVAEHIFIHKRKSGLENFVLKTEHSVLKDNAIFKYRKLPDWLEFVDKVIVDGDIDESSIAVKDLVFFAPQLKENRFFAENMNEKIGVTGKVTGRVNQLNVREVDLVMSNTLSMKGSMIARNLTESDESLLNVNFEQLTTDIFTLQKLIPGFVVPDNFYKLKSINFNGRFDGYYQDFVTYGSLKTDLGSAEVDMRLNLKSGSKNASYSGKMNMLDFDLASWTDNPDFGNLSFLANVDDGQGLDLSSANVELGGEIVSFVYKNYDYKGIVDAKLQQNLFDGSLIMDDDNISFDFLGNINFQDSIPFYDFEANIKKINPKELNLSKEISHIGGVLDIKLKGTNVDNIIGSALGNKIEIVRNQDTLDFGHLAIASTVDEHNKRSLFIDSDMGNAEVIGRYKISELPDAAIFLAKNNYPLYTQSLKYLNEKPAGQVVADFTLNILDAEDVFTFLSLENAKLKGLFVKGKIDYLADILVFDLSVPVAKFSDYMANNLKLNLDLKSDGTTDFIASVDSGLVKSILLNKIDVKGGIINDTVRFEVITNEILDSIFHIEIEGVLTPDDNSVYMSFDKLNFSLLGEQWKIARNNEFHLGDRYLSLKNVSISDNKRSIRLKSNKEQTGLDIELTKIRLFLLNQWIGRSDFVLNGDVTAKISIANIFDLQGLSIESEIKQLKVNDQLMGLMKIKAITDLNKKIVSYDISLDNYRDKVLVKGNYGLDSESLDAELEIDGFPLDFLEHFLEGDIENTKGKVYGEVKITGPYYDLSTTGKGRIEDGYTEIVYLGTKYAFEDADFLVSKGYIDFTGSRLRDTNGQFAQVEGGLTHDNFSNLGVDVQITSEQFILLNTDSKINPTYYGYGQGKADVLIQGPFTNVNLDIIASTGPNTRLTLPIAYANSTRDQSFIPLMSREEFLMTLNATDEIEKRTSYVGLKLDMELTVNSDAIMTILFDPITGHQITGRGSGDIQFRLDPKNGEINMLGTYTVDQGQYDFALVNLNIVNTPIIKKEFAIRKGGTITWDGEPLEAVLDLDADYKILKIPLTIFLSEFLGDNTNLSERAKEDQDVQVTVALTEKLLSPTIHFDIGFPTLSGELKSIAENKLTLLKSDALELNNQTFGLLIFNNFLPSNSSVISNSGADIAKVILNDLLSSQLSSYVSSIMESVLNEDGFLYDVEVEVRVDNEYDGGFANSTNGATFKPKFNTDKFEVVIGGDVLASQNKTQIANGEFIFDYFVDEDKKIKIRLYGRTVQTELEGRAYKLGAGLYFRKEFSSFKSLGKSLTKIAEDIKEKEKQNNE